MSVIMLMGADILFPVQFNTEIRVQSQTYKYTSVVSDLHYCLCVHPLVSSWKAQIPPPPKKKNHLYRYKSMPVYG